MGTLCSLCESRRPRRYCPGVRADICAPCCGSGREITIDCPLDCDFLREARKHERPSTDDPDQFPNQDIQVSEQFIEENQRLLYALGLEVADGALSTPGAVDTDIREALDALIRTLRTRDSGLYYESRPANPIAAAVQQKVQQGIEALRKEWAQKSGMHTVRDRDVLGILVLLQRLEIRENNGRRRGRAFVDFLREQLPAGSVAESSPSLIL